MTKNSVISLIMIFVAESFVYGQIETSLNPLGTLFGRPSVTGEYIISDYIGIELAINPIFGKAAGIIGYTHPNSSLKQHGFGVFTQVKYYLLPYQGGDGLYLGFYARKINVTLKDISSSTNSGFKRSIVAIGITGGQKWIFDNGIFIESALGIGPHISEKYEWFNHNDSDLFKIKFNVDIISKFAVGYRFW